jgi:threonine dehydratase
MSYSISKNTIEKAASVLEGQIHRTPVLTSSALNDLTGAQLFFKCENFQKIGAFKARGATYAASTLNEEERSSGFCTHSSGNHGQAVAWAAQQYGVPAFIVMPSNAPEVKKRAVRGYGAEVIECTPTLAARESTLIEVQKKTGAYFLHPFDDVRVIAGQATCAKELIEDNAALDFIIPPVGGGGLAAGSCLSAHYFSAHTKVIGGEPSGASDAYRSLEAGKLIPLIKAETIADGLRTSLGHHNFAILQPLMERIILVDDDEIKAAMRLIWERLKIVIEPSCAVPLAAVNKRTRCFSWEKHRAYSYWR